MKKINETYNIEPELLKDQIYNLPTYTILSILTEIRCKNETVNHCLEVLSELKSSALNDTFRWSRTTQDYIFWNQLIDGLDMSQLFTEFEIEKNDCVFHKLYLKHIKSPILHIDKIFSKMNKDLIFFDYCFYKNGVRVVKCPHCGKYI